MKLLFIIFIFFLPFYAVGDLVVDKEACTSVDLSDRLGPMRSQGNVPFCAVFASADLLGYELGLKPPAAVSAFQLLANAAKMSKDEINASAKSVRNDFIYVPINHVNPVQQIYSDKFQAQKAKFKSSMLTDREAYPDIIIANAILNGKACLESEIPSQVILRTEADPEQKQFFLKRLEKLSALEKIPYHGSVSSYTNSNDQIAHVTCNKKLIIVDSDLASTNIAIQNWAAAKLNMEADDQCKTHLNLKDLTVHDGYFDAKVLGKSHDDSKIHELLDNQHPFILNLDACKHLIHCVSGASEAHATLVVGRRWNLSQKKCELKIRSSWGAGEYPCKNAILGTDCKDGNFWVASDAITSEPYAIDWVETKKP